MDLVLTFVLLGGGVILLGLASKYDLLPVIIGLVMMIACLALGIHILGGGEKTIANIGTRRYYALKTEFSSENEIVLLLKQSNFYVAYFYHVRCDKIVGGCPKPWPKKFTAVENGEKLIIVPITQPTENK